MESSSQPPELPPRASSSEPGVIRPNPFDDSDQAARKRRRTSGSPEPLDKRNNTSSASSTADEEDHATSNGAGLVEMDSDPAEPRTPERPSTSSENPPDPPSSKVTINLRNPRVDLESPTSPSRLPHNHESVDSDRAAADRNAEREMDFVPEGPPSTSGSPRVEAVQDEDDEDAEFSTPIEEISVVGPEQDVEDLMMEFPYLGELEHPQQVIGRTVLLINNSNTWDASVIEAHLRWLEKAIQFCGVANSIALSHLLTSNHAFWMEYPDIVFTTSGKRPSPLLSDSHRTIILAYYRAFIQMSKILVRYDIQSLEAAMLVGKEKRRCPELYSSRFLFAIYHVTQQDLLFGQDPGYPPIADFNMSAIFQLGEEAGAAMGPDLELYEELVNATTKFLLDFPARLEDLTQPWFVLPTFLQFGAPRAKSIASSQEKRIPERALQRGHEIWLQLSACISSLIDQHVTQVKGESLIGTIILLSDSLGVCASGSHEEATELKSRFQASTPDLPDDDIPAAASMEWKLDMLGRLIRCSQMQLRVAGVNKMCGELVSVWQRFEQNAQSPLLQYVGMCVLGSGLLEYILGPTCHPEIIGASGNIVGFLLVVNQFRKEHMDQIWSAVLTTKDPRVRDALISMLMGISNIFDFETVIDLCEKLEQVPMDKFKASMRTLWGDHMIPVLLQKSQQDRMALPFQPFNLCMRLAQEYSRLVGGLDMVDLDMQQLVMTQLSQLLQTGASEAVRAELYKSCLDDVAQKSPTVLGSLWCLLLVIKDAVPQGMHTLTHLHDLTRLIVDELDHAARVGPESKTRFILSGRVNTPRRDVVYHILSYEPTTLDETVGERLWDILIGSRSPCPEDIEAGWSILNSIRSQEGQVGQNCFIRKCFERYLPALNPRYFCEGTLQFVKAEVLSLVQEPNQDFQLDDESASRSSCLEQLWRIGMEANEPRLVSQALEYLAVDVYTKSDLISAYPASRVGGVHSSLVRRCFAQMAEAASKMKSAMDEDTMATEEAHRATQEQERTFCRSLQFLKYFIHGCQSRPKFSTPDLRPLMSQAPSSIAGDTADLKLQPCTPDGCGQFQSLDIGKQNTVGSLLALIRQVTGFQRYQIYFRGTQFAPTERDAVKTLEAVGMCDTHVLVRKMEGDDTGSAKYRPGSSTLQIEIMSNFPHMWEYLNLEERLAREMFNFLRDLPAEVKTLERFEDSNTTYVDIFPPGQPFRSLYAIHVLAELRELTRAKARLEREAREEDAQSRVLFPNTCAEASRSAFTLMAAAILDPAVCSHENTSLELEVLNGLIQALLQWLREPDLIHPGFRATEIGFDSPERFIIILSETIDSSEESAASLIASLFGAIFRLGALDPSFWHQITVSSKFRELLQRVLLFDRRQFLRSSIVQLMQELIFSPNDVTASGQLDGADDCRAIMALYLWSIGFEIIPQAAMKPNQCYELFVFLHGIVGRVLATGSQIVDFKELAIQCSKLLMQHDPTEHISQALPFDAVTRGLSTLLACSLRAQDATALYASLPSNLPYEIYWRFLFPRTRGEYGQPVPRVILNPDTRKTLYEIIFLLIEGDPSRFYSILDSINEAVPFFLRDDDEAPYLYDIPFAFDRSKAIRAPCGYSGLRNLSNTCYLNSLTSQLYMHPGFRQFVMTATMKRPETEQSLLAGMRKVFGLMQDSFRRSIDPSDFVGAIRTYDNTTIDVTIQMDVDEFYNLLFDRLEGQLLDSIEKSKFRSIFGGQIVQQIKSRECEHLSERLEPFAAIQCDIKGKKSLQESLQAYIDGEALEGDNKYKCSDCDRHVDAVKRSCLKDLPDSIMFHLKRFDFNLRTLQRSKINDHFAFPERIDMKPYTVEYLTDSANSAEDEFQLVGILVHSGTAEMGHYYSFIRERPSQSDQPSWVEFNDESVTPWDHADMEASTFGGNNYDGHGALMEKPYSAYMLMYQRTSSLDKLQQEALATQVPGPIRVECDEGIKEESLDDNTIILRRHCIFDPAYATWVKKLFEYAVDTDGSHHDTEPGSTMDIDGPAPESTLKKLADLAMEMFLSHLDQVVSRKKDLPELRGYIKTLETAIEQSAETAYSVYKYFYLRPAALRSMLLRNPSDPVRDAVSTQFIGAIRKISAELPEYYFAVSWDDASADKWMLSKRRMEEVALSGRPGVPVISGVAHILRHLWKFFHVHLKSWDEHFRTVLGFALMGDRETAQLLANDYLLKLCRIIAADAAMDIGANYMQFLRNVARRHNGRPPSYNELINIINHLFTCLDSKMGPETIVEAPADRLHDVQRPFMWTAGEVTMVHSHPQGHNSSFFIERLLGIEHLVNPDAADEIVIRLSQASDEMDACVANTLQASIRREARSQLIEPFLRVTLKYIQIMPDLDRAKKLLSNAAINSQQMHPVDIPCLVDFFNQAFLIQRRDSEATEDWHSHCVELMPQWIPVVLAHPADEMRKRATELVRTELLEVAEYRQEDEDLYDPLENHLTVITIQSLAKQCLRYLDRAYVYRRMTINREVVAAVFKVTAACQTSLAKNIDAQEMKQFEEEFEQLQTNVIDALRQLTVESNEEFGTDWESSGGSSDHMEGLTPEMNGQDPHQLPDNNAA